MRPRTLTFQAHDGTKRTWPVPRRGSPYLLIQAVDKVGAGGDEALAGFGLTLAETELVAEIVAWLEEHRRLTKVPFNEMPQHVDLEIRSPPIEKERG